MAGPNGATPKKSAGEWRPAFLCVLRKTGNIRLACQRAGINRTTAYRARDNGNGFKDEWDEAMAEAVDRLEQIAWERARKSSDTLLIFLLKAHRPSLYRERYEVSHEYVQKQAEKVAKETGLSVEEIIAEAERITQAK